jgi:hypothetical protein
MIRLFFFFKKKKKTCLYNFIPLKKPFQIIMRLFFSQINLFLGP